MFGREISGMHYRRLLNGHMMMDVCFSAQAIRYLQHWLYKNFKVVRFTDGFVSDQDIRLEFSILKGEIGSKEIRQVEL